MKNTDNGSGSWWDRRLFGLWVLVNGAAFLVIPIVGLVLERLASAATRDLIHDHRAVVVFVTAALGAAAQGVILGRLQWRLLRRRVPDLERGRWVIATFAPAFFVWLLVIAPGAVDVMGAGGDTLTAFRDGFVQALVLGPLIGLSQATALRGHSTRWAWWLAANIVTYLSGAALHEVGVWLQHTLSLPGWSPGFFPVVAIAIHGICMLWVTAPAATSRAADDRDRSRRPCDRARSPRPHLRGTRAALFAPTPHRAKNSSGLLRPVLDPVARLARLARHREPVPQLAHLFT